MAYEQQEWGTYTYDESKSLAENIAAAKAVGALVTVDKIKHIEDGIAKQIKSGVINEDNNGIVTGIKVTFTDDTTIDFSVNKATA